MDAKGAVVFAIGGGSVVVAAAIVFAATRSPDAIRPTTTATSATASLPAAPAPAPEPVPTQSPIDRLMKLDTIDGAIFVTRPMMGDSVNKDDEGALLLTHWSLKHLWWADVGVPVDETTFALTKKDPDEARGKRLCATGSLVQIEVEKTDDGKISEGLLMSWSGNLFHFLGVGSSGDLVQQSTARFCGVVVGLYDYDNSGGGVGHAVEVVGMFDLPQNKAKKPIAGLSIAPAGGTAR
jgi:hypothetical protein